MEQDTIQAVVFDIIPILAYLISSPRDPSILGTLGTLGSNVIYLR